MEKTPRLFENSEDKPTVKACPSFTDYFSQGFVLPAWTDVKASYSVSKDYWSLDYPGHIDDNLYNWGIHFNGQFLDYVDAKFYGKKPTLVFKANSPWRIITKPGWSVLALPLFYHFDNPLVAMPGIIDTDTVHQANIQLFYFDDDKTINIKQGDPLIQYIPFKRNDVVKSFDVRSATTKDQAKISKAETSIDTKFINSGTYRKMQIERDRNE